MCRSQSVFPGEDARNGKAINGRWPPGAVFDAGPAGLDRSLYSQVRRPGLGHCTSGD
jgi:hypothetical protein